MSSRSLSSSVFKRLGLAAAFAVLIAAAFWAPGTRAQSSSLQEVAPGVWFRLGERDMGHCNNIVIEMEDYLVVIDANFPSGANLVVDEIKQISDKPVKYVFDTHHHGDHLYGNPVWTKLGATTIAYHTVLQEIARYEPSSWQGSGRNRPDVAALGLETAEPPMEVFNEIPHVIEDASRRIELHFFGWAHTRGDGFAYLPNEGILITGDAITNGPFNFMGHANIGNWPNVIERAKALTFETVLPGHGDRAGRDVLDGQQTFFREIHTAVSSAVAEGKALDDIVVMQDGTPVSTSIELSDAAQNWVGDSFPVQVLYTYEEITQGVPHGVIMGGR